MPPRPLSPPAASSWRGRRRTVLALVLAAVILISAARIYRAHRAAAGGARESAAVMAETARGPASKAASASAATPPEARPESAARAGVEASNFYKDAFVLYAKLSDEEKKMFRQSLTEVDADKAAALFKKIQPILELLRQGAAADYCEWGLGPLDFAKPLPHLSKSHQLGKLAQWSAAYRFPNDPQGALGDLTAQARLGDHLADSVIGWLVQMSFEGGSNKVLSQNAGLLDEAGMAQAEALLHSSSVEKNVLRAFAAEAGAVELTAKKLAAEDPSERMKLFLESESNEEANHTTLQRLFQDEAALTAEFHYLAQIEQQMAAAIPSPDAQYQAWWEGVKTALPQHPLAALLLPGFMEMRTRLQQSQVERAMLSAGLTLLQNTSAQPAQFRDPVSGAAFAYMEKADGFELQSTFKKNGKPVTMSFTRR